MALPLPQFLKQLSDSTLMSIDDIKGMISSLPEEKRPKDGEAFARDLVRQKRLTAYQAQEVYAGRGKSLVLGNYVVLDKLGQGGMGMVLKAEHRRMKRAVALKVLSPKVTQTPEALRRFQREVEAAAKLRHPNIVAADDADEANGVHFLVMEYVEGSDLSALVKKSGSLTLDKALHCVIQAARGLEYAHTRGVVHRDIKPANLLLDKEGNVKILDMGLARLDSAGANQDELTGTGQIMGTVDYMAPEQAVNTKNADARADIYALGVTLWYLLTARPMYQGDTAIEKLMAHQTQPIPSLIELNQSVSAALQKVFEKLVAKTPAARYQTMTEVIAELERCRGGGDSKPSISAGPGEDTQLHNFLRSVKDGTKSTQTTGKPVATSTKVVVSLDEMEKTLDSGVPQIETDPETQNSLPGPLEIAAHKAATAGRTSAGRGSGKAKKPPVKLIAAGALGAVLLLFGIVVLVRDKDGNKVAEVVVPPGGTVEVKQTPPTPVAPTATVPKSTATPPKSVVPSTGTSSAPSVNFTGRNLLTPDVVDMHVQRDAQGFVRDAAGLILDHTGVGVATPVMHCQSPSVWKTDETELTAEIKELSSPDPESYVRIGFEKGRAQLSLVLQGKPGSRTWRINSTADYSSSDRKQYAEAPAKESAGGVWKLRVRYDQGTFEGYANDELVISAKNVDFEPAIAVASARKSKWLVRSFQSRRPDTRVVPSATPSSQQPLAGGTWSFGDWKPLFDGKSLAGWTGETNQFKVENGVLVNDGQRGVASAPGTYRDFEVELEFRLQDKANSGLGICYSGEGDPAVTGLEVQLLDDAGNPNVGPDQRCGALYKLVAVQSAPYQKWPAWNRVTARSLGDDLEVVLNGTSVVKTSRKLLAAAHPNHAGLKRDSGSICLFPYTARSEYRNFRVREATRSTASQVANLVPNAASVDLLAGVNVDRDAVVGKFTLAGGLRQTDQVLQARVYLPTTTIPVEYDLNYSVARTAPGGKALMLGFVWQGKQGSVVIDGFSNPPASGLEMVDGKNAKENGTYRPGERIPFGTKHDVVVRVRRDGVTVLCDGATIVDWKGKANQLSTHAMWDVPRKDQLFVGFQGPYVVHAARLTPVVATVMPPSAKAPFDAKTARAHQAAWAKHLGKQIETVNSVGAKMILIPPGEFLMGSTDEQVEAALKVAEDNAIDRIQKAERPQHKVIIADPLFMSATEVTIGQFRQFVAATNYVTEAEQYGFGDAASKAVDAAEVTDAQKRKNWRDPGYKVTDKLPVSQVSWNDAVEYCKWLSKQEQAIYRLPTEAEWEYACRAGTTTQYSFGDDKTLLDQYGWYNKNSAGMAHPVGTKLPNGWGLFDMHGSLYEWCGDYYDTNWYEKRAPNLSQGPLDGTHRSIRGCSWDLNASSCRSAYRGFYAPSGRHRFNGFRCVRTIVSSTTRVTPDKIATYTTPEFQAWLKSTQTMLAEAQIEEVSKKLVELNPGFDGKLTSFDLSSPPRIKDGAVVELRFYTDHVTDLSPLRALTGLRMLLVQGNVSRKGRLSDLSPLQGLQLTTFECQDTQVADLSPLIGMPINSLNFSYTMVSSLDPIKEMKLTALWCRNTQIADLSILSPMPLKSLYCAAIPATNITALNSCKDLKALDIRAIKFTPADLESLKQALPNCEITIVD
jgi:formylglycine-generating enzyme required for sulfatase activity/serine/threonine protein kinase